MALLKPQKVKDIWIHWTLIVVSSMILVCCFFYVYLPSASNHGETVTVPKLEGMEVNEMKSFLSSKKINYIIQDSVYKANVKPLTVLKQYPEPGSKVKKDRRIYVTVSSSTTPQVRMPELFDKSLRQAELMLKQNDLILDSIHYIPSLTPNTVIKQLVNHQEIPEGTLLSKGSKVTLVLGNGTGS
ncbi:MAG: penicillin-binding protein [Chitinophagaceae bacterium]|nr:penicillin-binding protein [Chitinophagaceae bacterium]